MHGLGAISIHSANFASQGSGMNGPAGASGAGFSLASLTGNVAQPMARGVSSTGTGSLGSQTVSTLLQTQDLNDTQIRGGGHGGGGHHGMKMTVALEGEEIEEAEESAAPSAKKKTGKTVLSVESGEIAERNEEGNVTEEGEDRWQSEPHTTPRTNQ